MMDDEGIDQTRFSRLRSDGKCSSHATNTPRAATFRDDTRLLSSVCGRFFGKNPPKIPKIGAASRERWQASRTNLRTLRQPWYRRVHASIDRENSKMNEV
ncbi:hypothetical protein, partial [Pandoraea communis]|uniref:hypothetical protein n=1 Tax=Pandoraea communis TaxID=2508297 RepID=UPI0025A61C6A